MRSRRVNTCQTQRNLGPCVAQSLAWYDDADDATGGASNPHHSGLAWPDPVEWEGPAIFTHGPFAPLPPGVWLWHRASCPSSAVSIFPSPRKARCTSCISQLRAGCPSWEAACLLAAPQVGQGAGDQQNFSEGPRDGPGLPWVEALIDVLRGALHCRCGLAHRFPG